MSYINAGDIFLYECGYYEWAKTIQVEALKDITNDIIDDIIDEVDEAGIFLDGIQLKYPYVIGSELTLPLLVYRGYIKPPTFNDISILSGDIVAICTDIKTEYYEHLKIVKEYFEK